MTPESIFVVGDEVFAALIFVELIQLADLIEVD